MDKDYKNYQVQLNNAFSQLVGKYNKLLLKEHTINSITEGNNLLTHGTTLINTIKKHIQSLETLLCDCGDFVEDVYNDLSYPHPKEDFVYGTTNGMLSYKGREYIEKKKRTFPISYLNACLLNDDKFIGTNSTTKSNNSKSTTKSNNTNSNNHTNNITNSNNHTNNNNNKGSASSMNNVNRTLIPDIGYRLKINTTDKLQSIPQMFKYYNNKNDKDNPPGVYCCIVPNVYIRVQFPSVIDSTKEYSRVKTIRCKYHDKLTCDDQRKKMANYHRSTLRTCNYAHKGDTIVKIGYPSRCSRLPRFGNPQTLGKDIKIIGINEIKNILMYGLSDLISAAVWFDYNKITKKTYSFINIA